MRDLMLVEPSAVGLVICNQCINDIHPVLSEKNSQFLSLIDKCYQTVLGPNEHGRMLFR